MAGVVKALKMTKQVFPVENEPIPSRFSGGNQNMHRPAFSIPVCTPFSGGECSPWSIILPRLCSVSRETSVLFFHDLRTRNQP